MTPGDAILTKLRYIFGQEEGEKLFASTLGTLGLATIRDEDDELAFGEVLVPQGGLLAVIGRTIISHALLQGASPSVRARSPR
jgi:hypothetical protein